MATVVIDPGHGGTQSLGGSSPNNATGPGGLKEKTVTLQVGLAARRALARSMVKVLLTRDSDENVGIVRRAKLANDANAAAFVSIHFNAAASNEPAAQGTETWIGDGHSAISRDLATRVQRSVVATTGYRDRGVKVGNVSGVIKPVNHDPDTANCLVEISFLDRQPAEERRLGDPAYIQRLGDAVAAAIIGHLRERGLPLETQSHPRASPAMPHPPVRSISSGMTKPATPHDAVKSTSYPGTLFADHGPDHAHQVRDWLAQNL